MKTGDFEIQSESIYLAASLREEEIINHGGRYFTRSGCVRTKHGLVQVDQFDSAKRSGGGYASTILLMIYAGRQHTALVDRVPTERYTITLARRFAQQVANDAQSGREE